MDVRRGEDGLGVTQPLRRVVVDAHESWLPCEHPLYRPRHSAKQRLALFCAVVFFWAPQLALLAGVRPAEIENHRLAGFPLPSDGWGQFTELPQWAIDHLPFRGSAIDATSWVSRDVFGEPPPFDTPSPPSTGGEVSPVAPPVARGPQDRDSSPAGFVKVIEGKNGWLYIGEDIQNKCHPAQSLDEVMLQLNRLRQAVEASGRWLVIVVAPDKSTMVPENLPRGYAGKGCATALSSLFWLRITAEAGALDLRKQLADEAKRVGHPVYFQQDTHWTFEGGLVMTRALAESVRPNVTQTWQVTPGPQWRGRADLPPLIGRDGEVAGQYYSLAPDGRSDRTDRTPADFREPVHMTSSPTTGTVPNKVTMLVDSYSQFAKPFLGAAFNDLTIMHLDTARRDMPRAGQLLTGSEYVVVEVAERHLASGLSQVTDPVFVDEMTKALTSRPRRR